MVICTCSASRGEALHSVVQSLTMLLHLQTSVGMQAYNSFLARRRSLPKLLGKDQLLARVRRNTNDRSARSRTEQEDHAHAAAGPSATSRNSCARADLLTYC